MKSIIIVSSIDEQMQQIRKVMSKTVEDIKALVNALCKAWAEAIKNNKELQKSIELIKSFQDPAEVKKLNTEIEKKHKLRISWRKDSYINNLKLINVTKQKIYYNCRNNC